MSSMLHVSGGTVGKLNLKRKFATFSVQGVPLMINGIREFCLLFIYACECVYIYIHMYIYMYMYICVCVFIYYVCSHLHICSFSIDFLT